MTGISAKRRMPIGVFDSGVGGLTVAKALINTLPNEDIVYIGDTARVPYGTKSKETVTRFSIECIEFLKQFDIKLAIVACNTASSFSIDALRSTFEFPIMGVIEPGVKEACLKTKNRKVGIIGTKATVRSCSYVRKLEETIPGIQVFQKACPLFVPIVEEKWFNTSIARDVARVYLKEIKTKGIDTLILGCTHYPLLKNVIKKVFGRKINIIDSSVSVSNEVKAFLESRKMRNDSSSRGSFKAYVTDDADSFMNISSIFLKKDIPVNRVVF